MYSRKLKDEPGHALVVRYTSFPDLRVSDITYNSAGPRDFFWYTWACLLRAGHVKASVDHVVSLWANILLGIGRPCYAFSLLLSLVQFWGKKAAKKKGRKGS